ncbi:hypothetical protein [Leifsonia xyli]|uniref:hypothetical protein n=1 Tax=Leifsonia xyli TaxID=1575 RepID=UPI003D67F3B1
MDDVVMVTAGAPRRTGRVWIGATAFVLLATSLGIGAGAGWQALALEAAATADRSLAAASDSLDRVTEQRGSAIDKAHAAVSSLDAFVAHPRPDYVSEPASKALAAAQTKLRTTSKGLTYTPFDAPHAAPLADLLPWTVLAHVQHAAQLTRSEVADRRARAADVAALSRAQKTLTTAATAVYTELAAHGEQVLTADASATYASRIDLRHAIDAGKPGVLSAQFGGSGLLGIVTTVDEVNAAQAAGEAAKQDPAYPVRLRIEDYARSIAHGVTLDFEWHHLVSGLGDDWYSGTTQYHEDDGGWATIDLNFGVQDGFGRGDVDARALVTHEVGHAQVVRPACKALFVGPVFHGDDEMWATAWAISMGFDTAGSGIEAYGRPSDQQIAVAGQCR